MYLKDITGTSGSELSGKRIAMCVSGSVSITQAPRIARLLMRHGAEVIPVLTPKACEFVSPAIFEWSTGNPPITKLTGRVEHVELVSPQSPKRVNLILIAPCTANLIGKISSGICDEPVSTLMCTALGGGIPILIASAMHGPMLKNPVIQEAKAKLQRCGVKFVEGSVLESKSKLAEPDEIVRAVISEIGNSGGENRSAENASLINQDSANRAKTLSNLGVIVTAGPTREPIDQVRFITNASSGKMGVALAEAALAMGAKKVCLIHGPGVSVPATLTGTDDRRVVVNQVVTTMQMQDAVISELGKKRDYGILISAGAPADYAVTTPIKGKISTAEKPRLNLELSATRKIVSVAKKKFPRTFVVAFKAEFNKNGSSAYAHTASDTLKASGADIVVVNDVGRTDIGFGSDYNEVCVATKDGKVRTLSKASKQEIAAEILEIVAEEANRSR